MSGRNIINTAAIDEFLTEIVENCHYDATAAWLLKTSKSGTSSASP
jgi:hypothetical protein